MLYTFIIKHLRSRGRGRERERRRTEERRTAKIMETERRESGKEGGGVGGTAGRREEFLEEE